jgi:fructose-1,6-bisphosphatase/inositol monophosphatase family enzyme
MAEYNKFKAELIAAERLAREAGKVMLKYFDTDQQAQIKPDGSPVTIADTTINQMVLEELGRHFPRDGVIGEEASSKDISQARLWYCDPIDGTKAYRWGSPTAMFSLGLLENGKPVLGVAYDPFAKKMFTATTGQGAFVNGEPIRVSDQTIDTGFIAVSSNISKAVVEQPGYLVGLAQQKAELTVLSGAVFKSCLVATGRCAGYLEDVVGPHDIAAVDVIVTEAGGKVTGWDGQPLDYKNGFTGAILSNGVVHEELLKIAALGR